MNEEPRREEVADDDHEPVTKGDVRAIVRTEINSLRSEMATKSELAAFKSEIKSQMTNFKDEIIRHFDVTAENIHKDVAGANQDKVQLIEDKQNEHEERLTHVEKTVGVR